MNTEAINGKTFVEEDYPIQDIGGGVISKGQAVRHFEKKHPEYTVVAISSFKIDHQAETISVRVQVRPKSVVLPDDNQKPVDPMTVAPAIDQKLLNPGYDELLVQAGNLVTENTELKRLMDEYEPFKVCPHCVELDELLNVHEELKAELEVTRIAALAPCEMCKEMKDGAKDPACLTGTAVETKAALENDNTPVDIREQAEVRGENFDELADTATEVIEGSDEESENAG